MRPARHYAIRSFQAGCRKFGYGVVRGANPGKDAKLPTSGVTSEMFEGVVVSGIAEHDFAG
jgi:hypothetical protein